MNYFFFEGISVTKESKSQCQTYQLQSISKESITCEEWFLENFMQSSFRVAIF